MTFKKRTSLSTLSDSKWMEWAIQRTGIPMPNCVTYATARISEILNRREYLDDPASMGHRSYGHITHRAFTNPDMHSPEHL